MHRPSGTMTIHRPCPRPVLLFEGMGISPTYLGLLSSWRGMYPEPQALTAASQKGGGNTQGNVPG